MSNSRNNNTILLQQVNNGVNRGDIAQKNRQKLAVDDTILIFYDEDNTSNDHLNSDVVIPSIFLTPLSDGSYPLKLEISLKGNTNKKLELLNSYMSRTKDSFDSYVSYIRYINDVSNSFNDITNAINALKNMADSQTTLASISLASKIDDNILSRNETVNKVISGRLSANVQMPRQASNKLFNTNRQNGDLRKTKTPSVIKDVMTIVRAQNNEQDRQYPTLDFSRQENNNSRTTSKYAGKMANNESRKSVDIFREEGKIYIGNEYVFSNYHEADSSFAMLGKSVANCFNHPMLVGIENVLNGNIDSVAKRNISFYDKNGSANITRYDEKNSGSHSYKLGTTKPKFLTQKYFISLPKTMATLNFSSNNIKATIIYSNGQKKEVKASFIKGNIDAFVPSPIKNASVSTNDIGNNILSIAVDDKKATGVKIYKRERTFSSNKIKSKMKLLTTINMEEDNKNRKNVILTYIDKNNRSQGIIYEYRLISFNKYGDSYDFYDVVSKASTTSGSTFKQTRTGNSSGVLLREDGKKISIKINNIHPSVTNVRVTRKNLTKKETVFTEIGRVSLNGVSKDEITFEDKNLREWNEYEYSYITEDRFGNISKEGTSQNIRYQHKLSNDPMGKKFTTETSNMQTLKGSLKFDINTQVNKPSSLSSTKKEIALKASIAQLPDQSAAITHTIDLQANKDDLSKDIPVYKVDIYDLERQTVITSDYIKGATFDSSKMNRGDILDFENKQYRVVVTTSAVDLDKVIDNSARQADYKREFSTITNFDNTARSVFDDAIVNEHEIIIGKDNGKKTVIVKNIKVKSELQKNIVSWDVVNDLNVDFYIVEKSSLDTTYPWQYFGKTMSNKIEDKLLDVDFIVGVKYRISPFYIFNEIGNPTEEGSSR